MESTKCYLLFLIKGRMRKYNERNVGNKDKWLGPLETYEIYENKCSSSSSISSPLPPPPPAAIYIQTPQQYELKSPRRGIRFVCVYAIDFE